jgi:hypothetical protein
MRKWTTAILISSGLGVAGGCIIPKSDCDWDNTCNGAQNDGGGTDSGSDAPPPCNPRLDPRCLDDNKGFFVKQGALNGDGTRAKPLGSIQDAVAKATGERNQIFVCGPTYTEAVRAEKNVNLYGGFVCDAWTAGTTPTKVSAPKDKYALEVAAGTVDLADFVWEAAGYTDADTPLPDGSGHSSIAAFLHGNSKVTAARTKFAAGAGGKGKDAVDDASTSASGDPGQDGSAGGKGGASTCGVAGGNGGVVGVSDSTHGTPGPVNENDALDTFGKRGCTKDVAKPQCITVANDCGPGGAAKPGAKGDGATGVGIYGTLAESGWGAAKGADGKSGGPGGGGGGGGRGDLAGATGGGGGAGGCGGKGGSAGGGGGASIAVLIKDATFACDESCGASSLKGGNGGRGGKGQAGGAGGARGASATACTGGFGAGGSGGQGGQGGSAGLAAGVVFAGASSVRWAGNAVAADASTLPSVEPGESGSPGAGATDGGSGGAGGNGSTSGPLAGEAGAGGAAGFSEPGKKYAAKKL